MAIGTHTNLWIGTIAAWSTATMLGGMVAISMTVSWCDDRARKREDTRINERTCEIIAGSGSMKNVDGAQIQWQRIKVGDVLRLREGQEIPADVVVLAADSQYNGGVCYAATANLDGETDLKLKHAIFAARSDDVIKYYRGHVYAKAPETDIYNFTGRLELSSPKDPSMSSFVLGMDNVLLRGCRVRNARNIICLVVYTGEDTRIMMNSHAAPSKLSNVERTINHSMWVAVAIQALLAFVIDITYNKSDKTVFRHLWYLYPNGYTPPSGALPDLLAYLIMYFVLYSNFVPVSLYATLEICNTMYAYFIARDPSMICTEDTQQVPAVARSTNLCHELGQISHIFSDKTGTLTKNIMTLVHVVTSDAPTREEDVVCMRGGFWHATELQQAATTEEAGAVWEVLAVCHTGVWNPVTEKLEFESPDEEALVRGVSLVGWRFWNSGNNAMEIRLRTLHDVRKKSQWSGGRQLQYNIIAINKFTSSRKRMSVVVEKDGETWLLVKGADNVMEQCARGGLSQNLKSKLALFSKKGLRTLVLGRRNLADFDVDDWVGRYKAAQLLTTNRDSALEQLASSIEQCVSIVGCTAIEDELQDDVVDTIVKIRHAGIKFWVLTGDKMETAISIGYSAGVLDHATMSLIVLATKKECRENVDSSYRFYTLNQARQLVVREPFNVYGLVLTGDFMLEIVPHANYRADFTKTAAKCQVVILARCSPLQKSQMVNLLRNDDADAGISLQPITLAIGDGANDVPMIMAAHVGVGIVGREGHQAANTADFAIGQFRFLQNLLFDHGRTNYRRACKCTRFTFWRNALQVLLMFYYTPLSGYTGTTLFEDNLRITFNFICTIPIIAIGLFDRDISSREALHRPELYNARSRQDFELSRQGMLWTLRSAFMHSAIVFTALLCAFPAFQMNSSGDYWTIGCFGYTLLVHSSTTRAALLTSTWNVGSVFSFFLTYFLYAVFLAPITLAYSHSF